MKKIAGIATLAGTAAVAATISLGGGTAAAATDCGTVNGASVSAGPNTSCAFARNTAAAYFAVPDRYAHIIVYSPATGQNYYMDCTPGASLYAVCSGGNDAWVYID